MTRYEAAHQTPAGPGDARPTAFQIIQDENRLNDLSDKTIFITGCSSGIGVETARALYATGATLYLTARDLTKLHQALPDLIDSPRVHPLHLDLNSLSSVRACAAEFKSKSSTLNILIMNAGVMACPEGRTSDGFETQFGTNHLAHFLLFYLLKSTLLSSATPQFNSRVVMVSSVAHRFGTINFDNIALEGEYEAWKAYGQSKTANIWTANEIERRYGAQGLHALSLHPGSIVTDLQRHIPAETKAAWNENAQLLRDRKSPEQGAATSVWAAVARELEGAGGKYLDNCTFAKRCPDDGDRYAKGYAPWTYDEEGEGRLWVRSVEMLGLAQE